MTSLGFAALLALAAPLQAQEAAPAKGVVISLGTAESFGVIAASAITNTGASVVTGDLGISPNNASSVTGFPPGIVLGTSHFADGVALQAQNDVTTAFNALAGSACGTTISADLGGSTLAPGVYCTGSSMGLTGTLTLDAQNDPNAIFIFQMGSTLTTASNSVVRIINGGQSCNVFWQVGSSATLGTGTAFLGSILAQDSITLTTGASTSGRLLARTGAVTLDGSAVSVCTLAVPTAPGLSKAFNPSSINAGGVSTLTITLSNPNAAVATLTSALVDNLPNGVVVAPLPNLATTCGGAGAPVATAGSSSATLPAGRTIPANGSCTLAVDVTAAVGGSYINTIPVGGLATSNGDNPAPAIATLTVIPPGPNPPILGKAFNPTSINPNGISTLTVTLSNPNLTVATLTSNLVDTLPSGVVIAPQPNVGTTCGGAGVPVANAGGFTVTLPAGRTIPANGSCALTVDVTAALAGTYVNTLLAGALVTSNGNNPGPAVATLTVTAALLPPTLAKSFNPISIIEGGVSTLTVTLSNPNISIATLTSNLLDTLPSGVVVAPLPNVATTCGGAGAPVANAGGLTVTLPAGRTIPANGSCSLSVDVTAALAGTYVNTLPAGALVTNNGNNPGPAVATLTVTAALLQPTLAKAFNPTSIMASEVSTLTVTLNNPNAQVAILTSALTDNLPNGVLVAQNPNVSTTCLGAGAPVATAGSSSFSLPAGRSIAANGSCTVTVTVTASTPGVYTNTLPVGALATSVGDNPAPAVAVLTVTAVILAAPELIPGSSEWSSLLLAGLLLVAGWVLLRNAGRH